MLIQERVKIATNKDLKEYHKEASRLGMDGSVKIIHNEIKRRIFEDASIQTFEDFEVHLEIVNGKIKLAF